MKVTQNEWRPEIDNLDNHEECRHGEVTEEWLSVGIGEPSREE